MIKYNGFPVTEGEYYEIREQVIHYIDNSRICYFLDLVNHAIMNGLTDWLDYIESNPEFVYRMVQSNYIDS